MNQTLNDFIQRFHFAHGQSYDRHAGVLFGPVYRRVAGDVAAAAPERAVVLDAGCGTGRLAAAIAVARPDLRVKGVDLEPGMIEVATERAEREGLADRVEFVVADLVDIPFADDSVDLVVSTASSHHWNDVGGVIRSLTRVLRPDGRIWIYDFRIAGSATIRAASSALGRRFERTLVRTDPVPVALFHRVSID